MTSKTLNRYCAFARANLSLTPASVPAVVFIAFMLLLPTSARGMCACGHWLNSETEAACIEHLCSEHFSEYASHCGSQGDDDEVEPTPSDGGTAEVAPARQRPLEAAPEADPQAGIKAQREFEAGKKEAIESLKGVSHSEPELKGTEESAADLGLKGVEAEEDERAATVGGLSPEEWRKARAAQSRLLQLYSKARGRIGALSGEELAELRRLESIRTQAWAKIAADPNSTAADRDALRGRLLYGDNWVGRYPGGGVLPENNKAPGWGQVFREWAKEKWKEATKPRKGPAWLENLLPKEDLTIVPSMDIFEGSQMVIEVFHPQDSTRTE